MKSVVFTTIAGAISFLLAIEMTGKSAPAQQYSRKGNASGFNTYYEPAQVDRCTMGGGARCRNPNYETLFSAFFNRMGRWSFLQRSQRIQQASEQSNDGYDASGAFTGPPGPPAPTYGYPYYTTRAPRDFLMDNPPSIGR